MKAIARQKSALLTVIIILCAAEVPISASSNSFAPSTKASITPVKLLHMRSSPMSVTVTKGSSPNSDSVAKISRVFPVKRVSKQYNHVVRNNFFKPETEAVNETANITKAKSPKKKHASRIIPLTSSKSRHPPNRKKPATSRAHKPPKKKSTSTLEPEPFFDSAEVIFENGRYQPSASPLVASNQTWNYFTDVINDQLRPIVNSLNAEMIQNISEITARFEPDLDEHSNEINFSDEKQQPRMLKVDNSIGTTNSEEGGIIVGKNDGVRYTEKMTPILNISPLSQIIDKKLKKGTHIGKTRFGKHKNLNYKKRNSTTLFGRNHDSNGLPDNSHQMLDTYNHETLSGAEDRNDKTVPASSVNFPFTFLNEDVEPGNSSADPRNIQDPTVEEEYQIPALTTAATVESDSTKGYHTIPESTTLGPKIVWYNHNQTPEDTFYPNSDNFLVPPEEASLEILSDMYLKPVQKDVSLDSAAKAVPSFSVVTSPEAYVDSNFKTYSPFKPLERYRGSDNAISENSYYYGRNNSYNNNKGLRSSAPTTPASSLLSEHSKLQPAATVIEHDDGIREYYEDQDVRTNGGGSGKRHPQEYLRQQTAPYPQPPVIIQDHYHGSYPPLPTPPPYEPMPPQNYYPRQPNGHISYLDEGDFRPPESTVTDIDHYKTRAPDLPHSDLPKEGSPYYGHHHHHHDGYGHYSLKDTFMWKAKNYLKNADFSTTEKWLNVSIGVLAFLAFGGYIIMLLYQVFTLSTRTTFGSAFGKSIQGANELLGMFYSDGPLGRTYLDELETTFKRAMSNVKTMWMSNRINEYLNPLKKLKGEDGAK